MTDRIVMHTLYRLADFPVLAALARSRTTAKRLDGRACLYLYQSALSDTDWPTLSIEEQDFMRSLGGPLFEQMLAESNSNAPPAADKAAWDNAPPVSGEVI